MKTYLRAGVAGLAVLGLALGTVLIGQSRAADDKINGALQKIAAAIKKGDKEGAKSQAAALAKSIEAIEEVMDAFKPRKKGGLGVGKQGQVTPDGIELKLITLGRDAPSAAALGKEADALEEMAYVVAAIAEVSLAKAPKSNMGKKTVKDWNTWSTDMRDAAIKLAEASKAKGGGEVKTAASKVNAACNSCHSVFR